MEIKNGVPIPEIKRKARASKYPFSQMEVGDSLSVEGDERFAQARRAANLWGKRHDVVFTTRKGYLDGQPSDSGGTIWRVE